MAGRVRLASGKSKVNVVFNKAYKTGTLPIVTISARSNDESVKGAWVSDESETGFSINRLDTASQVEFNWIAIGVSDAKVTVSDDNSDGTKVSVNDVRGVVAPAPTPSSAEATAGEPAPVEPVVEEVVIPVVEEVVE